MSYQHLFHRALGEIRENCIERIRILYGCEQVRGEMSSNGARAEIVAIIGRNGGRIDIKWLVVPSPAILLAGRNKFHGRFQLQDCEMPVPKGKAHDRLEFRGLKPLLPPFIRVEKKRKSSFRHCGSATPVGNYKETSVVREVHATASPHPTDEDLSVGTTARRPAPQFTLEAQSSPCAPAPGSGGLCRRDRWDGTRRLP